MHNRLQFWSFSSDVEISSTHKRKSLSHHWLTYWLISTTYSGSQRPIELPQIWPVQKTKTCKSSIHSCQEDEELMIIWPSDWCYHATLQMHPGNHVNFLHIHKGKKEKENSSTVSMILTAYRSHHQICTISCACVFDRVVRIFWRCSAVQLPIHKEMPIVVEEYSRSSKL